MKSKAPNEQTVLSILARDLDDGTFMRLFPGQEPQAMRDTLLRMSGRGNGVREELPSTPQGGAVSAKGLCRLFTDGASRGNPGEAGAGAVLFGQDGAELAATAVYLGVCTNNVAEYKALLIGLKEARRQGCADLAIFLDSELLVRQIQGAYKVKNEALRELFIQTQELLAGFASWTIQHVPRAQNAKADALANEGIDRCKK